MYQYGLLFPVKKVTNVPKQAGNVVVTKPVAIYETEQVPLKYSLNDPWNHSSGHFWN